VCFTYDAFHVA